MNYNGLFTLSTILIVSMMFSPINISFSSPEGDIHNLNIHEYDPDEILNITQDEKWQMNSAIHGDNIVWEDYRDDPYGTWGSPGNRNSNIYLYNIDEDTTYQITTNTSTQINPDIWENYVVWEDYRNGDPDIYYADISPLFQGEDIEIERLTESSDSQEKPKIDGGFVVWEDYRENSGGDVYIYDLLEGSGPYRLNTADEDGTLSPTADPDIHNNKVVWTDNRAHWIRGDIFLYDLTVDSNGNGVPNYMDPEITHDDPAEIEITNQSRHQHSPSIYGDTVVWTEYNSSNNNDIYFRMIDGERTQISIDGMRDDDPKIYGETIVYQKREYDEDGTIENYSIWLYDLQDGEHELVQEIPADSDQTSRVKARSPSIYKYRLVWEENHPSNNEDIEYQYDIFYYETEIEPPIIKSAEIANQTREFGSSTEMKLVEGNKVHFKAEVVAQHTEIESINANISSLNIDIDHITLEETEQHIYEGTLEYSKDILEGEWTAKIEVLDSVGNYVESEPLTIVFSEPDFEFTFVGVGSSVDDLGNETTFILEEGNSLFFAADLSDFEGEVSRVYVDVSSFELETTEFDLSLQDGIYLYEYEYEEDITTGEKTVTFHATSERGQEIESHELTVDIMKEDSIDRIPSITENEKWQMNSAIHGDNIVWEDYRDDPYGTWASPGNRNSNIYLYNIDEETTYQITTNTSTQINPDIWENYVVWEDYRDGDSNIYYTDISPLFEGGDLEIKRITEDIEDQIRPKIHDGIVVWEDYRENRFGDIYMYEIIEERGPFRINTRHDSFVPHSNPDIYENKIVWTDFRNHWGENFRGDIFMYDLTIDSNNNGIPNYRDPEIDDDDPAEIEFANESYHQHSASIYKDTVVFTQYRSTNNNDIYVERIGRERRKISFDDMKDSNPSIYGGTVVYQKRMYDEDGTATNDSIWYYNIYEDKHNEIVNYSVESRRTFRVKARSPAIYQNSITWEEAHPSNNEDLVDQYDIFHTKIENKAPEIVTFEVANETKEYGTGTQMKLIQGNMIHFRAEVVDKNGDIESVVANISNLNLDVDHITLQETDPHIYEGTLEYSKDILEGEWTAKIEVLDSVGNHVESEPLTIVFSEPEFEFTFVGVGSSVDDLGNETTFILEEGNSLFFAADLSDFEGEVSRVYVDVSSFELETTEFDLSLQDGIHLYEYEYEEDITTGEKTVTIHATSERGQEIESHELTVDIIYKPTHEPQIISYGVGRELSELKDSIDFELKEGNYVYFITEVDHGEDISYDVYLDISEFGLEKDRVEMVEKIDENTYYYRFEYSEDIEPGEKSAYIYVEDVYGQNETSGEILVDFRHPDEPWPIYYYVIPIIVVIAVILGLIYWKKPEYFKKLSWNNLRYNDLFK